MRAVWQVLGVRILSEPEDEMKPHEETWTNPEDFEVTVLGPELDRGIDQRRETLARAAPEMARALLRFRNAHLGQDSAEEMEQALLDAEVALTKAGVPLP